MLEASIREKLGVDDDPSLWDAAASVILVDVRQFENLPNTIFAQIGRCNRWIRPHQSRWTGGGGFAAPFGYDKTITGYSFRALPEFDWSVYFQLIANSWTPIKQRTSGLLLRIAIPGRTLRHAQAAIHTVWMPHSPTGDEKIVRLYGFRKEKQKWQLVATYDRLDSEMQKKSRRIKPRNQPLN